MTGLPLPNPAGPPPLANGYIFDDGTYLWQLAIIRTGPPLMTKWSKIGTRTLIVSNNVNSNTISIGNTAPGANGISLSSNGSIKTGNVTITGGSANGIIFSDGTTQFTSPAAIGSYANSAFTRANNSLNSNTGGTVTANVTISANLTASNVATQTYIQFGDGTKQYTANAGSGGGGGTTDWGFGVIYTPNNSVYANATTANDTVRFVGESGTVVYANATTKTITVAGTPGAQGLTVDYGYVCWIWRF